MAQRRKTLPAETDDLFRTHIVGKRTDSYRLTSDLCTYLLPTEGKKLQ